MGEAGTLDVLKHSHEEWNSLAASFCADIEQQPRMVTGGELREYQMHVSPFASAPFPRASVMGCMSAL